MVDRIVNLMARSSSSTDKFLARHNSIFFHPSGKSLLEMETEPDGEEEDVRLKPWKKDPERQAESLVRVAQEGFNLRDQLYTHQPPATEERN